MASTTPRELYHHDDLRRLIDPGVVAIVGASETRGSFGERTLSNMSAFTGKVFAINPKYQDLARPALRAVAVGDAGKSGLRRALRCAADGRGHDRERRRGEGRRGRRLRLGLCGDREARPHRSAATPGAACAAHRRSRGRAELRRSCQYALGRRAEFHARLCRHGPHGAARSASSRKAARSVTPYCKACSAASGSRIISRPAIPATSMSAISSPILPRTTTPESIICLLEGVKDGDRFLGAARQGARRRQGADRLQDRQQRDLAARRRCRIRERWSARSSPTRRRSRMPVRSRSTIWKRSWRPPRFSQRQKRRPGGRGVGILSTSGGAAVICADKAEAHGVPLAGAGGEDRERAARGRPGFRLGRQSLRSHRRSA